MNDKIEPVDEAQPAERVAKRALILAAIGNRGLIENELHEVDDPDRVCNSMVRWIERLGIGDEAEPNEWRVLQRGPGSLEPRATIDAAWRLEGLAVLLWALQRYELPPYDELASPARLFQASRLFGVWGARRLIARAKLRSAEQLAAYRKHALMTHWRLLNQRVHPGAVDFVAFSRGCWCGQFDITRFQIVDNDLALGGIAITEADPALVAVCESIAVERHRAIDWVVSGGRIYSETDTST